MSYLLKPVCSTIILMLTLTILASAEVPDGAWNNKPWLPKKLMSGVAKGDKDALAEWAYCSLNCYENIAYDGELVFQRAQKAAAKSSALGQFLLSTHYIHGQFVEKNPKEGIQLLKKAVDQGHPLAQWKYDVYLRHGNHGVKKDTTDAIAKIIAANKKGVREASWSMAVLHTSGQLGTIDLEKAAELYEIAVIEKQEMNAVFMVYRANKFPHQYPLSNHLSKKIIRSAERQMLQYVTLGHPYACYNYASFELIYGNPHVGIPLLMETHNETLKGALYLIQHVMMEMIFKELEDPTLSRKEGCYLCNGFYQDFYACAKRLYKEGVKTSSVEYKLVESTLQRSTPVPKEQEKFALELARKNFELDYNSHRFHHLLAEYFTGKFLHQKVPRESFDRGMSHYMFHSNCLTAMKQMTEIYLTTKDPERRDLAKGYAAAHSLLQEWRYKDDKRLKEMAAQAKAKMNPKQLKEAETLIKQKFPSADQFREKAFKELQGYGDIPDTLKYREEDPENTEEESANLRNFRDNTVAREAMYEGLSSDVYEQGYVLCSEQNEGIVLDKYLAEEELNAQELSSLAGILLSDEKYIQSLLKHRAKGKFEVKGAHIQKVLGKEHTIYAEDTPMKAAIGWYISYDDNLFSSVPQLVKAEDDSPAIKAGLLIGDIITSCQGHDTSSTRSRNNFMRLLALWPKNTSLDLVIKRRTNRANATDRNFKHATKKYKVLF